MLNIAHRCIRTIIISSGILVKKIVSDKNKCILNLKAILLNNNRGKIVQLYKSKMKTVESSLLLPPKHVRGMTVLDRNKFNKTVKIPRLEIGDVSTASVMPHIKQYLLKMDNLKPVQTVQNSNNDSSTENKVILLNPVLIKSWNDIEYRSLEHLVPLGITEKCFKVEDLVLKYDNWRPDEILKAVLPADKDILSSYSLIGHIVHVNLRDHLLPYKKLIGEVLLDKIKLCKTVVNKLDAIDSTYRFFKMEILSGEDDMMVQVKENHCRFKFDFSRVYWNPRLCTEHERITMNLKEDDILYDVFAGVGPFAIPAARKKCIVLANDLNPDCYEWLNHNSELNKIKPGYLQTFNLDGRVFILSELKNDFLQRHKTNNFKNKVHVTMNLPAIAVEFLDTFYGLFDEDDFKGVDKISLPIVHVYCFVRGDSPQNLARELVQSHLGFKLDKNLIEIFNVRNVSFKKDMMRVSFELTREILCGTAERTIKKRKLSEEKSAETKKSVLKVFENVFGLYECLILTLCNLLQCAMGKKNKNKNKNVFKVVGAKSLKLKAKAKKVNLQLKQINSAVRKNVDEINKQCSKLETELRKISQKKNDKTVAPKPISVKISNVNHKTVDRDTKETIDKINEMEL